MEFTFEALGSRIAKPSIEVLASICNELEVTPDYLMMGVMRSNNVPKEIADGLRLCSAQDLELVRAINRGYIRYVSLAYTAALYCGFMTHIVRTQEFVLPSL